MTTRTHSSEERLEKSTDINGELERKGKERKGKGRKGKERTRKERKGAQFLLMKSVQQILYYKSYSGRHTHASRLL